MTRRTLAALTLGVGFLLPSCGDSDTGSGGGGSSGSAQLDAGDTDAAEGPWECLEGNIAHRKADGETKDCGLVRCTVEDGCGNTALGCKSNDDCVSSTAEAGWEVDLPVTCRHGMCAEEVTTPEGGDASDETG